MSNKKTHRTYDIAVITHEPFPLGMAATNRMISYLKPLCTRYISAKVMITRPTEKVTRLLNKEVSGTFEGIHFEYVNHTTIWPDKHSKLKKLYLVISAYFYLIYKIYLGQPRIIITYTSDLSTKLLLLLSRPFLKYNLIIEETEYPKILKRSKNNFIRKIHLSLYKRANGMLVMTSELEKYYRGLGVSHIFLLPMTVDISRFNSLKADIRKEDYFAYVGGSGGFLRDGVLDIIKAFEIFSEANQNFSLLIVGPIDKSSRVTKEIYHLLQKRSLAQKVILTGAKATNEIPGILMRATGIVMAPPKNFESGGFPTKLGEFLASGTPTICTRVSDISTYLNESNCFLVEPGDIYEISKAMQEIVSDAKTANTIGSGGRTLASVTFNAETYISGLMNFLNN